MGYLLLLVSTRFAVEARNKQADVVRVHSAAPQGWRRPLEGAIADGARRSFLDSRGGDTIMRIGSDYFEVHRLPDGTEVRLRLLRASDRGKIAAGFRRLSPQSRYRRFFSPMPRLSERMLRQLTQTDDWDHLAIIAEPGAGDGAAALGVARYVRLRGTPETAESSVAVIDEMQRKGLGRLLCTTLIEAARERGIHRFRFSILAENEASSFARRARDRAHRRRPSSLRARPSRAFVGSAVCRSHLPALQAGRRRSAGGLRELAIPIGASRRRAEPRGPRSSSP